MAELFFEDHYGNMRKIADCRTSAEVSFAIDKFIKEANARKPKNAKPFVRHYTRYWEEDGMRIYDVGSHSEFFKVRLPLDE